MYAETNHEKLTRLRPQLADARRELAEADAILQEKLAEIRSLDRQLKIRLGELFGELASLDSEIERYTKLIELKRGRRIYGAEYLPIEEQYRRTWEQPASHEEAPEVFVDLRAKHDEEQIKRLYRRLARQFHPDLARDQDELIYRTEKMAALNEAYAARSYAELAALAAAAEASEDDAGPGKHAPGFTSLEMVKVLERELQALRRQTLLVRNQIDNLHNHPIVQMSLEIKLAEHRGQDLVSLVAGRLRDEIAGKLLERERLIAILNA